MRRSFVAAPGVRLGKPEEVSQRRHYRHRGEADDHKQPDERCSRSRGVGDENLVDENPGCLGDAPAD
ncbi:hypothetical protein R4315_25380, partial [Rhodococcus oxybenzonivorans]